MQKKIGILGFGVVGKSALNFLQNFKQEEKILSLNQDIANLDEARFGVWDQKPFEPQTCNDLTSKNVDAFDAAKLSMKDFIESHDYIIPSPGVNLNDYYSSSQKFICELDLFSTYFKKPVVAITGSLGKTTTTKLFGTLLAKVKLPDLSVAHPEPVEGKPFVGGNIGLGMLEAIEKQDAYDMGVLELSSFQLEFSKKFAPDLAIMMNCYPNHLDRHKSFKDYFDAKFNLFKYQNERQHALFPIQVLSDDVRDLFASQVKDLKSSICFVSDTAVDFKLIRSLNLKSYKVFYKQDDKTVLRPGASPTGDGSTSSPRARLQYGARSEPVEGCELQNISNKLMCYDSALNRFDEIFDLSVLPDVTFVQNWILIVSGLYLLGADLAELQSFFATEGKNFAINDHHHRVEHFATINGVSFYDDSKATVIQSTLAAVKSLTGKGPVILILGGLNKGVDRSPIIKELEAIKELKKVYCFGPACADFGSASCNMNTLDDIVQDISKIMQPGDQVLFSPSGTSFDFFQNYKHRGQVFKELINRILA